MIKKKTACDLNTCFLCRFCLQDWKIAIDANKENIKIKKGQQIFTEGGKVEGLYFIYSGKVKVHKKWDQEKELIVRFAQKGDMIGYLGLGRSGYFPVSATAIEDVVLCQINLAFLESTMAVNNNFVVQLMHFFADELQQSEKRMSNLAHMSVKGRVAQALLSLQDQFGVSEDHFIKIELTRQDIASYTGASYESLFRTMNDLVAEQLIHIDGKRIAIRDKEQLRSNTKN